MCTEVSRPPAKLLEKALGSGSRVQKSRRLGRAEASPSLSCGGGLCGPRYPRFAPVSQEGRASVAQQKDSALQAIVCASPILLTPQLLCQNMSA